MTTLDPHNAYATLINAFEVDPCKADKLIEVLHEASNTKRKLHGLITHPLARRRFH